MIVVMTPALDTSEWVTKEVLLARNKRKPVFPLLLDGEGYPLLIDVQYLDVRSGALPGPDFTAALRTALDGGGIRRERPDERAAPVGAPVAVRSRWTSTRWRGAWNGRTTLWQSGRRSIRTGLARPRR
jgi:hypothetical protein